MHYYGTHLSENISRRDPEGYLLCLNVPVARTGIQEYMPEELGLQPGPVPLPVSRPAEEVFSPETVASFEGMPVTNNHPPDGVTAENIRAFQRGHAHNVRRGAGNESDLLLADLIITDPVLIDAILAGKREISCGYTYDLCEENGTYVQRNIRGNHVAVVDAGRAGPRVSIRDHRPSFTCCIPIERRNKPMKKSLIKKLTQMARDGDPEAIEALAEAVEELTESPSPAENASPAAVVVMEETPAPAEAPAEAAETTDSFSEILSRLDQLIALLSPVPAADDSPVSDPAASPEETLEASLEQAMNEVIGASGETGSPEAPGAPEFSPESVAEIVEEMLEPDVSSVLEPKDENPDRDDPLAAGDALRAALKAIRPALKRMSRRVRTLVCRDIARGLKKTGAADTYAALSAAGSRPSVNAADLGRKIMAARNPNYR